MSIVFDNNGIFFGINRDPNVICFRVPSICYKFGQGSWRRAVKTDSQVVNYVKVYLKLKIVLSVQVGNFLCYLYDVGSNTR